jgi:deoxyribonuclease-4
MKFGVHVSIAGSYIKAINRAVALSCDTFQIFTKTPRSWKERIVTEEEGKKFHQKLTETKIFPVFSHISYLPNLASPDTSLHKKTITAFLNELQRCDVLKIPYLVTHPGSPIKKGKQYGIIKASDSLNEILKNYTGQTKILLENIAGPRRRLGAKIIDLIEIINRVDNSKKMGLCFDTCHAFASGYDLRKKSIIAQILDLIEDDLEVQRLLLVHCNDSKYGLGEGKDRHEHLGLGKIGKKGFVNLLSKPRLQRIPFICETPVDKRRNDRGNLEFLNSLRRNCKK